MQETAIQHTLEGIRGGLILAKTLTVTTLEIWPRGPLSLQAAQLDIRQPMQPPKDGQGS